LWSNLKIMSTENKQSDPILVSKPVVGESSLGRVAINDDGGVKIVVLEHRVNTIAELKQLINLIEKTISAHNE